MSYFTCISCGVAFPNGEVQRAHYKTDWHRYNLKRKVSELPPVTAENFKERVLAHRPREGADGIEQQENQSHFCNLCRKHFNNRNSYENHLKSRKHEEAVGDENKVVNSKKPSIPAAGSAEPQSKPNQPMKKDDKNLINESKSSQSSSKGLSHVESSSSMVVEDGSDGESGADVDDGEWEDVESEALELEECLFCSLMSETLEQNIKHMTVEHSFFIPDVEYLIDAAGFIGYLDEKVGAGNVCLWCNMKGKAFYSTKSAQQHMIDKGHCKVLHEGDALQEYADFYDYSQSYPEEEGGSDEVNVNVLDDEGFQLVLPSGSTIGHRSLMKYYRQNLRPTRPNANRKMVNNVMSHYRALGWTGTTGEAAIRKAKDLSLMHMKRSKYYMQLGVKHNKLQKYFRQQNPI